MGRKLYFAGIIFFAVIFAAACGLMLRSSADRRHSAAAFREIAALVPAAEDFRPAARQSVVSPASAEPAEAGAAQPALSADAPEAAYAAVLERNSDMIGWVSIPGTAINYPVMHTPEQPEFYLRHGFDGAYSSHGVPFLQGNCDPVHGDNSLVYGHHMKDGTMFAELCRYEDREFFLEHPCINYDTLWEFGTYEIFAVFKTSPTAQDGFAYHLFTRAANEAAFSDFVDRCRKESLYDTGVDVQYGDRLLTLSTCEYSRENGRMVIVARKPLSLS